MISKTANSRQHILKGFHQHFSTEAENAESSRGPLRASSEAVQPGHANPRKALADRAIKVKRRKTKRERNYAKFGRFTKFFEQEPSGAFQKVNLRSYRCSHHSSGRALAPHPTPGNPTPVIITHNRLTQQHLGIFNREVKSADIERLLNQEKEQKADESAATKRPEQSEDITATMKTVSPEFKEVEKTPPRNKKIGKGLSKAKQVQEVPAGSKEVGKGASKRNEVEESLSVNKEVEEVPSETKETEIAHVGNVDLASGLSEVDTVQSKAAVDLTAGGKASPMELQGNLCLSSSEKGTTLPTVRPAGKAKAPVKEVASKLIKLLNPSAAFAGQNLVKETQQSIIDMIMERHGGIPDVMAVTVRRKLDYNVPPPSPNEASGGTSLQAFEVASEAACSGLVPDEGGKGKRRRKRQPCSPFDLAIVGADGATGAWVDRGCIRKQRAEGFPQTIVDSYDPQSDLSSSLNCTELPDRTDRNRPLPNCHFLRPGRDFHQESSQNSSGKCCDLSAPGSSDLQTCRETFAKYLPRSPRSEFPCDLGSKLEKPARSFLQPPEPMKRFYPSGGSGKAATSCAMYDSPSPPYKTCMLNSSLARIQEAYRSSPASTLCQSYISRMASPGNTGLPVKGPFRELLECRSQGKQLQGLFDTHRPQAGPGHVKRNTSAKHKGADCLDYMWKQSAGFKGEGSREGVVPGCYCLNSPADKLQSVSVTDPSMLYSPTCTGLALQLNIQDLHTSPLWPVGLSHGQQYPSQAERGHGRESSLHSGFQQWRHGKGRLADTSSCLTASVYRPLYQKQVVLGSRVLVEKSSSGLAVCPNYFEPGALSISGGQTDSQFFPALNPNARRTVSDVCDWFSTPASRGLPLGSYYQLRADQMPVACFPPSEALELSDSPIENLFQRPHHPLLELASPEAWVFPRMKLY
ncbi:uncharacterized protein LOC102349176 [Latimeria chalumnae]|uniref:uncharacterized protein LOC102349176 n=1 Tax=Latimeria chalumnae TaxID=7897 RepID=UPI0003C142CE|nr:PREDICTED: proline-rich protein 19 [Latimeria chalumnae]|eukprot:XP_005998026.1 PREDICTED: proline-rich protein 19 [Latimeria chalumnae]